MTIFPNFITITKAVIVINVSQDMISATWQHVATVAQIFGVGCRDWIM